MKSITDITRRAWHGAHMHLWLYHRAPVIQRRRVQMVQRRGYARVVFLAMNVPMWKYQRLYQAMLGHPLFRPTIVLSPSVAYVHAQQQADMKALRDYFDARDTTYIDWDPAAPCDIGGELDPDIIFYPQPYEHLLVPQHDCTSHYDRLLCFYPYSFMTGSGSLTYNLHFHNMAWRLYYPNSIIASTAQATAHNHGCNVRVVGHPVADEFAQWHGSDPWCAIADGRPRRRIIWAPHFAFTPQFGQTARSNFLWMAHFMLDLAQRYQEFIQVAFKPHPRLLTELYAHPEWGKQRTDDYYRLWSTMPNTQLELGQYVDLFMTSDAMIHDCASFVIEYLYTHKPVMFVSRNIDQLLVGQTDLSREAFGQLYIGCDEREIIDFVDNVVLGEEDTMAPLREGFVQRRLLPRDGQTVAHSTIADLVNSLGLG